MQVYVEGTHLMIPWFERPVIYDVRARPHLVESTSGSRDLQMVNASLISVASATLLLIKTASCNVFTTLMPKFKHFAQPFLLFSFFIFLDKPCCTYRI
jgi:hypothetical protein